MSATSRQKRHRPRRGVRIDLGARDHGLLAAIGRFRIVRSGDLIRWGFPGVRRDTAARRLCKLLDGGLVRVEVPHPAAENVYSLSPAGRVALGNAGVQFGTRPRGSLDHHLLIVAAWVRLLELRRHQIDVRLVRPDWELRAELPPDWRGVVPDLFVGVSDAGRELAVGVEVDCGTESLGVLRTKFKRYAAQVAESGGLFGWPVARLLVVTRGVRRAANITGALQAEWPAPFLLWSAEGEWAPPGRELARWLVAPVTESPCGEGTASDASSDATAPKNPAEGGP